MLLFSVGSGINCILISGPWVIHLNACLVMASTLCGTSSHPTCSFGMWASSSQTERLGCKVVMSQTDLLDEHQQPTATEEMTNALFRLMLGCCQTDGWEPIGQHSQSQPIMYRMYECHVKSLKFQWDLVMNKLCLKCLTFFFFNWQHSIIMAIDQFTSSPKDGKRSRFQKFCSISNMSNGDTVFPIR
jgi:hypothetical protein